jgi:hypothetical protein
MRKNGYHLSLSLSRELWEDLLQAALPVKITDGEFDLAKNTRALLRQLQVRERVAGLLEDRRPPPALVKARDRAREIWHKRREGVYRRFNEVLHVEGTYKVQLDDMGSQFRYGAQKVGADAYVKGVAQGTIFLLRENVEIPFTLEKRVGVSVTLGDIRYDREQQAVIGSLQDLGMHLGDNAALQLVGRLGEYLLEQQLPRVNPVPILKRAQVDEMVGGLGGPLKMKMGVETLELEVTEDDLTLSVRFGFSQLQLEDRGAEAGEEA